MHFRLLLAVPAIAALSACSQVAKSPEPTTDDEKAMYSLGVMLAQNIQSFELTDAELVMVKAGLADGAQAKAKVEMEEVESHIPRLQALQTERAAAAVQREKDAGSAYIEKAAAEAGARKLESGFVYKEVSAGSGVQPTAEDTVRVHYEGRFVDGKVFDSSIERGEPAVFPLNAVIRCWTEGLQQMKVGGKAQLTCPSDMAYGDQPPSRDMRAGATLVFDVELLGIETGEEAAAN